ncbi:MAG: hypothetical protein WD750_08670 [Gammaproteobacteria bacterium]
MTNQQDVQTLIEKRDELLDRLERIRADLESGLETDMEDQAIQLENRDTLMEIARVTEEELERVLKDLEAAGGG